MPNTISCRNRAAGSVRKFEVVKLLAWCDRKPSSPLRFDFILKGGMFLGGMHPQSTLYFVHNIMELKRCT
jgi:hypothetical protein